MQRFFVNKLFKVVVVASFFVLLIAFNPYNFFNPIRSVAAIIFLPFQKISYSVSFGVANFGEFVQSIGQLKNENEKLQIENQTLVAKNAMLNDMQSENAILREQLKLLPRDKYELTAATIISQDPHGMDNWLEIDKGSVDGVVNGMSVVVSSSVLVGRIQDVGLQSARVVLLTNSRSTVNVMTSQNNTKGVAKGEYGLGIIFDMILQTDAIAVGDEVVTSGVGGEIPRGLYVGSVQEVRSSDDGLFQQAVISSPLKVSKLQTVFIIKSAK
ncbi:MAG: rod shape-determining protein MreC [bacterium]